jgi:hypothetical protein
LLAEADGPSYTQGLWDASTTVVRARGEAMTPKQLVRGAGTVTAIGAFVVTAIVLSSPRMRANDDDHDGDSRVRRGFEIAPVHLNLARKNRELVGLGSYIVNGVGDCNGCHSAGPQTEFIVPTGNPYFLTPPFSGHEQINPAVYLGGGRDFGPFPGGPGSVNIISRNLTPDHTGLPEGGATFSEFLNIIRTGVDMDHLHPHLPFPFDGAKLQIMPWPIYRNMTDHDLRAIYEYLSAVPCVASAGHIC